MMAFGNHEAVRRGPDQRNQIVEPAVLQRVDANPQLRGPADRTRREKGVHHVARRGFAAGRDGILEVENQGVGAVALAARDLLLAVAGNEQKRT